MKLFLNRILLTILDWCSPKIYDKIDIEARDRWLMSLIISEGFQSYFKYRDLQILKTLGNGVSTEDYWMLVGQRKELLFLIGESKRVYEREKKNRSSRERDYEDV